MEYHEYLTKDTWMYVWPLKKMVRVGCKRKKNKENKEKF